MNVINDRSFNDHQYVHHLNTVDIANAIPGGSVAQCGSMAQWLACMPCVQEDVGSNPAPDASEKCLIDWHSCVSPQVPVSRIDLKWALYKYITFLCFLFCIFRYFVHKTFA